MRRGILALSAGNGIGKVLGLIRELLLAALFGTGTAVTAFRVANTGTFVPMNLLTADALSVGFLPNHSRLSTDSHRDAAIFYRTVQRFLMLAAGIILLLLLIARNSWPSIIAPGLAPRILALTSNMLLIMALAVPFYIYSNIASFLAMSRGNYTLASARPAIQSLGLISGTIVAYLLSQPVWLAIGFTTAYVMMSIWSFCLVSRNGYAHIPGPRITRREAADARRLFLRTIYPILWLPVVTQGAWVGERAIASTVDHAAVAALDYARMITETTTVMISTPIGLVMLSTLAAMTRLEAAAALARITRSLLFICIPISCVIATGSTAVITAVYGRGAFGEQSIAVTSSILVGLSLSMWAQALTYAHIKALNAQRRNWEAAIAIAAGVLAWLIADLLLVSHLGSLGLGFGAGIGALVQLSVTSIFLCQFAAVARGLASQAPVIILMLPLSWWTLSNGIIQSLIASAILVLIWLSWTIFFPPCRAIARDLFRGSKVD